MRKCRNWQTSKTKDLVIIAIVWVQVPSSALNNKTGIKRSVWSLSYCSMPKRALNPWFKVSPPARSARGMSSPGPQSPHLPQGFGYCVAGAPWVQGLRSAPVGAEQTSPGCLAPHLPHGSDCCGAGAHGSRSRLRLGRCRTDVPPDVLQPVFRKASVVAWQAPMGPRSPLRYGRCSTDVPQTSCNPSSALYLPR